MRTTILTAMLLVLSACGPNPPEALSPRPPGLVGQPMAPGPGAPTIHFVITGDTLDRYNCISDLATCAGSIIATGFAHNVTMMNQFAGEIPRLGSVTVNSVLIQGNDFTCQNITAAIERLPVKPNVDVVWFHHSGHGANSGAGPDPEFQWLQCDPRGMQLTEFRRKIQEKQPKLALIFADSCNVQFTGARAAVAAAPPLLINYLPLLTAYSGSLMGAAAKPGEFAWYTADGGTYTRNLMSMVRSSDDWDTIVNSEIMKGFDTPGAPNTQQHPIFKSALRRLPIGS